MIVQAELPPLPHQVEMQLVVERGARLAADRGYPEGGWQGRGEG